MNGSSLLQFAPELLSFQHTCALRNSVFRLPFSVFRPLFLLRLPFDSLDFRVLFRKNRFRTALQYTMEDEPVLNEEHDYVGIFAKEPFGITLVMNAIEVCRTAIVARIEAFEAQQRAILHELESVIGSRKARECFLCSALDHRAINCREYGTSVERAVRVVELGQFLRRFCDVTVHLKLKKTERWLAAKRERGGNVALERRRDTLRLSYYFATLSNAS